MAIWHVAPLRFAPAFRALGVCEHIWPFSLRDIWATLLSPKWAEIFVAQMAGDETSLPLLKTKMERVNIFSSSYVRIKCLKAYPIVPKCINNDCASTQRMTH